MVGTQKSTRPLTRPWAAVGSVLLALWLLSPVLHACYVEAYMARLQSMAMMQHAGTLALDDQAYPVNTEMLYVTRLGMVWLLDGAMTMLRSNGIWVLRR